jgi:hypothetical protein
MAELDRNQKSVPYESGRVLRKKNAAFSYGAAGSSALSSLQSGMLGLGSVSNSARVVERKASSTLDSAASIRK